MALLLRQSSKYSYLFKHFHWQKGLNNIMATEIMPVTVGRSLFTKSLQNVEEDPDNSKPVKFTTSEAAEWRAEYSRAGGKNDDKPPLQPVIVSLSVAVFLLYFLAYREESDIDIKLGGGTTFSAEYLELIRLKTIVTANKEDNKETDKSILDRLKEIEAKLEMLEAK